MQTTQKMFKDLDKRLIHAARPIGILRHLDWKPEIQASFLKGFEANNSQLPKIHYKPIRYPDNKAELRLLIKDATGDHPLLSWLRKTAESYIDAIEMVENIGTPAFCEFSKKLYGTPYEGVHSSGLSHLDGAKMFIEISNEFKDSCSISEAEICITPQTVISDLQTGWEQHFPDLPLSFQLDESLMSKAAAGAKRVRVRSSTCFSDADCTQLLNHECFVHSLTAINGKSQPVFKSMGLGAPRTTRTQEGLALFAELVSGAIDLSRLRRIALRIIAVQLGLEGANFIEVFQFFLENGQSKVEAFQSTARVFRGGSVDGRNVFTKGCVYLAGLTDVHTFLKKSLEEKKLQYPSLLFSGRLTLGDLPLLEPFFDSGLIESTRNLPPWARSKSQLSAFLLYSTFLNSIHLDKVSLADFS